jgi:hypothetical protein
MATSKDSKKTGKKTTARRAPPRTAQPAIRLPRDPKGRRAQFYDDPAIDQLWAILLALTAEVSVAFDRIDTLERLLEQAGTLRPDEVEGYRPDESASEERNRRREALIQRVFQVLSQYEKST